MKVSDLVRLIELPSAKLYSSVNLLLLSSFFLFLFFLLFLFFSFSGLLQSQIYEEVPSLLFPSPINILIHPHLLKVPFNYMEDLSLVEH